MTKLLHAFCISLKSLDMVFILTFVSSTIKPVNVQDHLNVFGVKGMFLSRVELSFRVRITGLAEQCCNSGRLISWYIYCSSKSDC